MTEEEKILALDYILAKLSHDKSKAFEERLNSNSLLNQEFTKFKELVDFIDFSYRNKEFKKEIDKINLSELETPEGRNSEVNESTMNKNAKNWIQYVIMIAIALTVSIIVFSIMRSPSTEVVMLPEASNKEINKAYVDSSSVDNTIQSDEEPSDIEIMGLAINRTGFYILPYSATKVKGVFGSNSSMTNNLPLNVVWDDKELGFAVATFADENLERLPNLPFRFSKAESFLGEELFVIHSMRNQVRVNKGIVIEDAKEKNRMKVYFSFPEEMFGAVLLDKNGLVVGLCEGETTDGKVNVVKSKALYKMISEMNLDKGIDYISMPKQNYLSSKSNAQRIESLSPFVAWFNASPKN